MSIKVRSASVSRSENASIMADEYRRPMIITNVLIIKHKGADQGYYVCPRCKISMEREFTSFCENCGQALDWSKYRSAIPIYPKQKMQ